MYDMTQIKKRYFNIKLRNGKILDLFLPKLKILKKIASLSKIKDNDLEESDVDSLSEALSLAISKNKQGYSISKEEIEKDFDIEDMLDFLNNYFDWVNEVKSLKN